MKQFRLFIRTAALIMALILALALAHVLFFLHDLDHTVAFQVFGQHVEIAHPYYDRSFIEVSGQYSIVPCYDIWNMQERTNCRVRNWGFGIDGWKPFLSWAVWSMDTNGNWYRYK
jgi:hypothetical protein